MTAALNISAIQPVNRTDFRWDRTAAHPSSFRPILIESIMSLPEIPMPETITMLSVKSATLYASVVLECVKAGIDPPVRIVDGVSDQDLSLAWPWWRKSIFIDRPSLRALDEIAKSIAADANRVKNELAEVPGEGAYGRGVRIGHLYWDLLSDQADEPANPYPAGSPEAADYDRGYSDGSDDWDAAQYD